MSDENNTPEGDIVRDNPAGVVPPNPAPSNDPLDGWTPARETEVADPEPATRPTWKQVVRHPLVVGALVAVAVGVGSGVGGYVAGWDTAISDSVAHHNAFHKGKEVGEAEVNARIVSVETARQRWLESGRSEGDGEIIIPVGPDRTASGTSHDGGVPIGPGISDTLPVVEERLGNFVIPDRTSLPEFIVNEDGKIVTAEKGCDAAGGDILLTDPPQCTEPIVVTGLVG